MPGSRLMPAGRTGRPPRGAFSFPQQDGLTPYAWFARLCTSGQIVNGLPDRPLHMRVFGEDKIMGHSSLSVARYMLDLTARDGRELAPMKMIKLGNYSYPVCVNPVSNRVFQGLAGWRQAAASGLKP